jgi:hypothetical protein
MIKAIKPSLCIVCITTFTLAHASTAASPRSGTSPAAPEQVGTWSAPGC